MNKKYGKKEQVSYKSIMFWGIIAAATLIFIGIIIFRFVEARTVNSYESLTQLEGEDLFKNEGKYLVFIYNSENENAQAKNEFDQNVFNYISFAKRNSKNANVLPIYGFDTVKPENNKIVISTDGGKEEKITSAESINELLVKSGNLPMLLEINEHKISTYRDSDNSISDYLQKIINDNK